MEAKNIQSVLLQSLAETLVAEHRSLLCEATSLTYMDQIHFILYPIIQIPTCFTSNKLISRFVHKLGNFASRGTLLVNGSLNQETWHIELVQLSKC